MAITRQILTIIAARNSTMYDAIFPHGPLSILAHGRLSVPHQLGAAIAAEIVHSAWQADRFGLDQEIAFRDLDDWCPTKPKWPKLPPWWGPVPEPEPHPDWHADFHLGFAARLAWTSEQIDSPKLRESLDKAIERSIEVIESATPASGSP